MVMLKNYPTLCKLSIYIIDNIIDLNFNLLTFVVCDLIHSLYFLENNLNLQESKPDIIS